MNRHEASFLVSAPIGKENWKTARKPLNPQELLFSGRGHSLRQSRKQENMPDQDAVQVSHGAHPASPKITRIYRPATPSDELIEALYELSALADEKKVRAPCFSAQPE